MAEVKFTEEEQFSCTDTYKHICLSMKVKYTRRKDLSRRSRSIYKYKTTTTRKLKKGYVFKK